jgi:hypothetical protein
VERKEESEMEILRPPLVAIRKPGIDPPSRFLQVTHSQLSTSRPCDHSYNRRLVPSSTNVPSSPERVGVRKSQILGLGLGRTELCVSSFTTRIVFRFI